MYFILAASKHGYWVRLAFTANPKFFRVGKIHGGEAIPPDFRAGGPLRFALLLNLGRVFSHVDIIPVCLLRLFFWYFSCFSVGQFRS